MHVDAEFVFIKKVFCRLIQAGATATATVLVSANAAVAFCPRIRK
jgi:hypothetical protein